MSVTFEGEALIHGVNWSGGMGGMTDCGVTFTWNPRIRMPVGTLVLSQPDCMACVAHVPAASGLSIFEHEKEPT